MGLGVVAEAHIVAQFEVAGEGRELAHHRFEEGGLAHAVGADHGHALSTLNLEVGAAGQHQGRLVGALVAYHQVLGLEDAEAGADVGAQVETHFSALAGALDHALVVGALETFEAAHGLGFLLAVFVAADKLPGALDRFLLGFVLGQHAFVALGLQLQVFIVGSGVVLKAGEG